MPRKSSRKEKGTEKEGKSSQEPKKEKEPTKENNNDITTETTPSTELHEKPKRIDSDNGYEEVEKTEQRNMLRKKLREARAARTGNNNAILSGATNAKGLLKDPTTTLLAMGIDDANILSIAPSIVKKTVASVANTKGAGKTRRIADDVTREFLSQVRPNPDSAKPKQLYSPEGHTNDDHVHDEFPTSDDDEEAPPPV